MTDPRDQPGGSPPPANVPHTVGGGMGRATRPGKNPAYAVYAVSIEFVVYVVVCTLLGWGIDSLAGTGKLWMTIGAIIGILGGAYRFVHQALKTVREQGRKD